MSRIITSWKSASVSGMFVRPSGSSYGVEMQVFRETSFPETYHGGREYFEQEVNSRFAERNSSIRIRDAKL
jgi:hypothetical protein